MAEQEIVMAEENDAGGRPVGGSVHNVVSDLADLVRAELRLARVELTEEGCEGARAARPLGMAALTGFFAVASLVTCLIVSLSIALPLWLATLLIAVVLGGTAGAAFRMGRVKLEKIEPVPQRTVETLKGMIQSVRLRAQ